MKKPSKPIDWRAYMERLKAKFRSGAISRDKFERCRAVVKKATKKQLFSS